MSADRFTHTAYTAHTTHTLAPRRAGALLTTLAFGALLAACGAGASTAGQAPSPTIAPIAPTATTAPTATPLAQPFHVPLADTAQLCQGAFGKNSASVYAFSHALYAEPAFALSYPSYSLPAGVSRQKPFALGNSINGPDLDQLFGSAPNANPSIASAGGLILTVCNDSAQPVRLTSVGAGILSMKPVSGPVDTWQICDGAYQPGPGGVGGGCGGAVAADENMRAAFATSATSGATASATVSSAGGPNGYGPLPVTLKPGATILITIAITMPTAPGTYQLGLTISGGDVSGAPTYAPIDAQLFAPDAHKWNGENCKAAAMKSQIPSAATTSYFICP